MTRSGWLTAEFTAKFKSEVKALVPGAKRLVLDLAPLTYMDSSGIGAVVGIFLMLFQAFGNLICGKALRMRL